MVKDLSNFFKNGDITAKERALLFVKDHIAFEKTGKHPLSESDRHALVEGWRPKDNYEVDEYNRYYEAWRMFCFAELDAQTTRLKGEVSFLTYMRLVDKIGTVIKALEFDRDKNAFDNYLFKSETQPLEVIDAILKTKRDPLEVMIENSGLELDYTIYRLAFESLTDEDKKYLTDELYEDIKTERGFLDDQEKIAELLDDTGKLSDANKGKLAELVAKAPYNDYLEDYNLTNYFANIPTQTIAERWADDNGIDYKIDPKDLEKAHKELTPNIEALIERLEDKQLVKYTDTQRIKLIKSINEGKTVDNVNLEKLTIAIKDFAKRHSTTVEAILKEATIKAIDEGLLDYHRPLVVCETDLYKRWIKAKTDAKATVDKLISEGKLKTEIVNNEMRTMAGVLKGSKETVITGESLFKFKGKFTPADEYKEQIEHYKFIGGLILFLGESPFLKDYGKLVGFLDTFKRLSKVYEVDLSAKTKGWVKDFEDYISELNRALTKIKEGVDFMSYSKHNPNFFITFKHGAFGDNYLVDLYKAIPNKPTEEYYKSEFKRLLGREF